MYIKKRNKECKISYRNILDHNICTLNSKYVFDADLITVVNSAKSFHYQPFSPTLKRECFLFIARGPWRPWSCSREGTTRSGERGMSMPGSGVVLPAGMRTKSVSPMSRIGDRVFPATARGQLGNSRNTGQIKTTNFGCPRVNMIILQPTRPPTQGTVTGHIGQHP